ncbi:MAG: DUF1345 domain-containing protein [Methyloceanibacter sp.]|nr:DUF1345 domain-containing protein [Methyloceanibacter sp.]
MAGRKRGSSSRSPSVSPSRSSCRSRAPFRAFSPGGTPAAGSFWCWSSLRCGRPRSKASNARRASSGESRIVVLVIVILGSLFTLLALVTQLGALKSEQGLDRTISVGLSVSTIFLSWLLIHVVFALYYAHEFHSESRAGASGRGGGLKFPDDRTPDYLDFLYFSFVVGTTAQTSDVEVTSRAMRGVVMLHGILSFFFNTAVIALTVNLAAQLVQG